MLRLASENDKPDYSQGRIRVLSFELACAALEKCKGKLNDAQIQVKEVKEIAEVSLKFLLAFKPQGDEKADELGVSIYALSDSQLDEIIAGGGAGKN